MDLTLTVTSYQAQSLGMVATKTFGPQGGSIGRSSDNNWILPDPEKFVSGHHAVVEYADGEYFLIDVSSNGTYVNGADIAIGYGAKVPVRTSDRFVMGQYEIYAELTTHNSQPRSKPRHPSGIWGEDPETPSQRTSRHPIEPAPIYPAPQFPPVDPHDGPPHDWPPIDSDPTDPFDPFKNFPKEAFDPDDRDPFLDFPAGPEGEIVKDVPPPNPSRFPQEVNSGQWRESHSHNTAHPLTRSNSPNDEPGPTPLFAHNEHTVLERVLERAGLDPRVARDAASDPELPDMLGEVLKIAIDGMIELLRARSEMRAFFRAERTLLQARENNPLKFSADAEEALERMFSKRRGGAYLQAPDALSEAFNDLTGHQLALVPSIKTAFLQMLDQFDPKQIQKEVDAKGGVLLGGLAKSRYWDAFVEFYGKQDVDRDASFGRLFGSRLAESFEGHLTRIEEQRARARRH